MSVVSTIEVYTVRDEAGNPRTTGWYDYEFQEDYSTGGVYADLSPDFRSVKDVFTRMVSGALDYIPRANEADFGTPASARIQLYWPSGSGLALGEITDGTAVSGARARLFVMGY